MSEGQMILMFCLIYSGALSLAIWANLVARQRMQAYIRTDADGGSSPEGYKQGA